MKAFVLASPLFIPSMLATLRATRLFMLPLSMERRTWWNPCWQALPLSPSACQNNTGRTALHCAAEQGLDEVARLLLKSCRFTDEAVNALAEEEVEYMLPTSNLVTIIEDGFTALHLAAKTGHVAVTEVLLESERFKGTNAVILGSNITALHVAAWYGHLGVVEGLLNSDRFNAVNALDSNGGSALQRAACAGHGPCVRALLRSLDFTVAPQQSWDVCFTALHYAAWQGHAQVVRVLLSETRFPTATVNAVNRHGGTALHVAARFGHDVVARALLTCGRFQGADSLDLLGNTALHLAAGAGQVQVARELVESARFTQMAVANNSGLTALPCGSRTRK